MTRTVFLRTWTRKLIPVQAGEPFSRSKITRGLEAARKLYVSEDYINVTYVPIPDVDDEGRTIAFTIDVDEGGQFRFGSRDVG